MADFMKVDMSRLGQAEGRSADSGMAAPSGADVDTFQQAMRRRPLDERQGSGGDESDGGRGASHAPNEDTSPGRWIRFLPDARRRRLKRRLRPEMLRIWVRWRKSSWSGFWFPGPTGAMRYASPLARMSSPEPKSGSSAGATACCRYIWRRTTRHPFRPSSAHRNL